MTQISMRVLPVDSIKPSRDNVRKDLGDLTELAASIRIYGLLQPIIVTPTPGGYQLVDGERRYRAARMAHVPALPALITPPQGRQQTMAVMLAAAMHKALAPIEQANAFHALRQAGATVAEVSVQTGYSAATIRGRLLLLALPVEAQDMVTNKTMTIFAATTLAKQVKETRSGTATTAPLRSAWLRPHHRLGGAAGDACDHQDTRVIIGQVACGQCWEDTIRADERGHLEQNDLIDHVAVQLASEGNRTITLRPNERDEAIRRLVTQGLSDQQIAVRLGVPDRTVLRSRQDCGVAPAIPRSGSQKESAA